MLSQLVPLHQLDVSFAIRYSSPASVYSSLMPNSPYYLSFNLASLYVIYKSVELSLSSHSHLPNPFWIKHCLFSDVSSFPLLFLSHTLFCLNLHPLLLWVLCIMFVPSVSDFSAVSNLFFLLFLHCCWLFDWISFQNGYCYLGLDCVTEIMFKS